MCVCVCMCLCVGAHEGVCVGVCVRDIVAGGRFSDDQEKKLVARERGSKNNH